MWRLVPEIRGASWARNIGPVVSLAGTIVPRREQTSGRESGGEQGSGGERRSDD